MESEDQDAPGYATEDFGGDVPVEELLPRKQTVSESDEDQPPPPPPSSQASKLVLVEPYEVYKSYDLRTECYRRGRRPTKSGPKCNDNKAGYIELLRAYDRENGALFPAIAVTTEPEDTKPATVARTPRAKASATGKSRKRSKKALQHDVVKTEDRRKRSRSSSVSPGARNGSRGVVTPRRSPRNDGSSGVILTGNSKDDYINLKVQLLLESRELDKQERAEKRRSKLLGELSTVITTLSSLRRLSHEYMAQQNTALVTEVMDDIAFFQEQKQVIKQQLQLRA